MKYLKASKMIECGMRLGFVCKCFMPAIVEIVGWVEVQK